MPVAVAEAVAHAVAKQAGESVQVIWHGGEPLLCGINHFKDLLAPFGSLMSSKQVIHTVQTNATLVDDNWCQLFLDHGFLVGVSIDGPASLNVRRHNWANRDMTREIVSGAQTLRKNGVPFSAIAVIGPDSLSRARELYNYFCDFGCNTLGIALQETKGAHVAEFLEPRAVSRFWKDLLEAWHDRPEIIIREFDKLFSWILQLRRSVDLTLDASVDPFPVVAWNGDVSLLSPELSGMQSDKYENFVIGNVLREPLETIVDKAQGHRYVNDFLDGVLDCRGRCSYFSYCRGGQASNKFFELGSTRGTETTYCRNTQQRLVDAGLEFLETTRKGVRP
jgi:uncharacterized protein